jgi:hypothetical protein
MATSSVTRPIAYNASQIEIEGTTNVGYLCIGVDPLDYSSAPGGLNWVMGADEDMTTIIARPDHSELRPRFWKAYSFLDLANYVNRLESGAGDFTDEATAKAWLNGAGYWTSYGEPTP